MIHTHSILRGRAGINRLNSKIVFGLTLILLISLVVGSATHLPQAYSSPISGSVQNISNDGGSVVPQVAVSGSNVYEVWLDVNGNVAFSVSTDNGATFSTPLELSSSGLASFPQVSASGSNVYVAWLDYSGSPDLLLEGSTDNGVTFNAAASGTPGTPGTPTTVSSGGTTADAPQIIASGGNVYMTWIGLTDNNIAFAASPDGTIINSLTTLSTSGVTTTPTIAASGSNVYVAWQDGVGASGEILYENSADSGATFNAATGGTPGTPGAPTNLSNTVDLSSTPRLAAGGSNVYLVWRDSSPDSNGDILFEASTNNGASFGSVINLSNNAGISQFPQVAASGSAVYVTWQDNLFSGPALDEILFKASTNNGASFGSAINLSSNTGVSQTPQISASGNDVFVTWQDKTINPTPDIFFKSSSDNGGTFSGLQKLNANAGGTSAQQISSSSTNVVVVWDENFDVFSIAALPSSLDVSFDKSQYSLGESPTITINDPTSNDPSVIDSITLVHVKSSTDSAGIDLTFTETGADTGVFTKQIFFNAGSSDPSTATLQAGPGDIITATFNGQNAIASTIPVLVAFTPLTTDFDRGAIAHIEVTDASANVDPNVAESISIMVSSNANPTGIPLTLTETSQNSGVFGSIASDNLIFMDNNNLFPNSGSATITQQDTSGDTTAGIDQIVESVTSTSYPTGININLSETDGNSAIFTGTLTFTTGPSVDGSAIQVADGDIVSITRSTATERGLVVPNPNPSTGALLVTANPVDDVAKVTYRGVVATANVKDQFASGGGGGGFLRPGLVLNVVASLSHDSNAIVPPLFGLSAFTSTPGLLPENIKQQVLNQDPTKPISPSLDTSFDYPLIIDGGGYLLAGYANTIQTKTETIGVPTEIKLNLPATGLSHLALYTNLRGDAREIDKSDTSIIYDKGQKLQISDPNGYFAPGGVKFDLSTQGSKNSIVYTITFAKPMEKSDIIFRAWNDRHAAADVKILNALQVEPSSQTGSINTASASSANTEVSKPVLMPVIKDWQGVTSPPISDSQLLSSLGIEGQHIPSWVSNTSKWVINGEISEQEFVTMMKYLASTGIVK